MANRYTTSANNTSDNRATTTSSSQTSNQTSNTTGTQTTSSTTKNMDSKSLAALNALISQLMNGGTAQMREDNAQRNAEIQSVRNARSGYTKEAAFADAQGAMAQQLRLALDSSLPMLVRAAQGAGSSQNSMRALLAQQAQENAAQAAAAMGLKAATDYGSINTNMSSILERLTAADNSQINALINALNIAKGAVTSTDSTTNTTGTTTTTGTTNTAGSSNTSTGSGGGSSSSGGATMYAPTNNMMSYFGGTSTPTPTPVITGSGWSDNSAALSSMLGGLTNRWQDYSDI